MGPIDSSVKKKAADKEKVMVKSEERRGC